MAVIVNPKTEFTTGSTALPDVGVCFYNKCYFSPLFESNISGKVVEDEAKRAVKYTEITLTLDGYVTLSDNLKGVDANGMINDNSIANTMVTLHRQLTAQGGELEYVGRGFDLVVNKGGGNNATGDLAWGPVPELLDFQPLGGGLSAKVRWRVTVRISPIISAAGGRGFTGIVGNKSKLLQFNYDTETIYGEDGFSYLSMRGTLEIPLTRQLNAYDTLVPRTADDFRTVVENKLLGGFDLARFKVTKRRFSTSRDKRTLTWDFAVEEKPYMDLPPNCPIARGNYDVRPAKAGPGLSLWMCTLRCTYILRNDITRRQAYILFLALMRLRMAESEKGKFDNDEPKVDNKDAPLKRLKFRPQVRPGGIIVLLQPEPAPAPALDNDLKDRKANLIGFTISEGIYLDSKSVTFSATWKLSTSFSHILIASGLWTKMKEVDEKGFNLWATSMADVNRRKSWLTNRLDPALDVIVDFGESE